MNVIDINDLTVEFSIEGNWFPAVSNVSFSVEKGEILALVGESGCGKSVTCMSLARLVPEPPARYPTGNVVFHENGKEYDILKLSHSQLRHIRGGKIAYIFQEPSVSLNPVFKVGDQIAESIILHRPEVDDIRAEVIGLLKKVGIPEPGKRIDCYPHEMSGGMQQRIMIAMALASHPDLLIADEPTTALDVTIQAQILDLLSDIRKSNDMTIILVTHNLGIVSELADRVIVMYAGHMVEAGTVDDILNRPKHPYTKALLSAVPKLGHGQETLTTIPGNVPTPTNYPKGCRFFGRCQLADSLTEEEQNRCKDAIPTWDNLAERHFCRCWYSGTSRHG